MSGVLDTLLAAKAALVAAWFLLAFALENARPAALPPLPLAGAGRRWQARIARNLALFAGNVPLSVFFVLPLSLWASRHPLWPRPAWLGGVPGLALDLVLLDLWIYFWHRANHEWRLLWRFHRVHHRDEFLDATTALRFHFGEVALGAIARLPAILLLAIPLRSVLAFETLVLIAAIFHHANWRLPPGLEAALTHVLVTPAWHWVHHHARRADTDANYGTLLSVWDRLFGTSAPGRRAPFMPIGVEGEAESNLPGLLLLPFRRG